MVELWEGDVVVVRDAVSRRCGEGSEGVVEWQ